MKLQYFLTEERIFPEINVSTKEELFRTASSLMRGLENERFPLTEEEIFEGLMTREAVLATGLGDGIAMPHARLAKVPHVRVILGKLTTPLEYDAPDGIPISLFAMVLIPLDEPARGLKIMAQLSRLFVEYREVIQDTNDVRVISRLIEELNLQIEEPILARDIMIAPPYSAFPETPLHVLTRGMANTRSYTIPVIDHENHLLGEIYCEHLLTIGIPDFFHNLKSVSFVSYFDPFAEYFRKEAHATAADVMLPIPQRFTPESTILEIVFALSVKKNNAIYVVDQENKLVGIIDPETVMNRVINY